MSKVRVYELARELGVTSKELTAKLKDMGEFVRSASSTVEPPVVSRLREEFPTGGGDVTPTNARARSFSGVAKVSASSTNVYGAAKCFGMTPGLVLEHLAEIGSHPELQPSLSETELEYLETCIEPPSGESVRSVQNLAELVGLPVSELALHADYLGVDRLVYDQLTPLEIRAICRSLDIAPVYRDLRREALRAGSDRPAAVSLAVDSQERAAWREEPDAFHDEFVEVGVYRQLEAHLAEESRRVRLLSSLIEAVGLTADAAAMLQELERLRPTDGEAIGRWAAGDGAQWLRHPSTSGGLWLDS